MADKNMENDYKKEARKQYLHYFRFWFIGVGVLAVLCIVMGIAKNALSGEPRTNNNAPTERVYDYADVLSDKEEENLREYIARAEEKGNIDIVLLTINQSVEGPEALAQGLRSEDWEQNMQDIADDFFDENKFGYNKDYEGDGILLLHNWYEGQNGEVLSTSGIVEKRFSEDDINRVFDAVDVYYDTNPYKAYKAYVDEVCNLMDISVEAPFPWTMVIFLPIIVAFIYAIIHLGQNKAENTTPVNAYVAGGKPVMNYKSDDFIRKNVTTRRIQTSSSSSGGGRSSSGGNSGGGGHHHSSSGASHGGGSRRH